MSCWSWFRCKPSDNQDPWASSPWSTPQWTQQEIPTWTYNRFRGFDDDDDTPPPSPRTPKHRILRSPAGILKERRDWRPEASPIRNPGISVRPENIPRLFPQTPGNGRPRSFVDPNPVVGETLANSIPTPRWQPINPWVGNSFVATPQNGSGQSLLCTPLATPGSLPQSVVPLPGATPVTMVPTPLPNATPMPCTPADTSSTWVHLRNFPAWTNTPVPGTPFTPSRCPQEMQNPDSFDDAPVIPQFVPHRPSLLRTPGSVRSHVPLTPGSTVAKIPSQTGVWMPMDQVGWEPHPCPDPMQHADAFWTPHPFSVPRQYWTPRDHASMMRLTGGVPAPGTAPGWVSPAWPMQAASPTQASISLHLNPTLTPNPNNAWLPHLVWDVSEHPSYARRLTGRDLTVPIVDRLEQSAVWPNSTVLHIYVDHHLATTAFWGPIIVKNKKAITIYDVLMAIFEYFQTQLRQEEYDYLVGLDPDNIAKMCDSFQQRCIISRNQLPLYERAQGLRRIDTFGDKRRWWGLWVTHKPGGAHYLNLGLVDTRRVSRLF